MSAARFRVSFVSAVLAVAVTGACGGPEEPTASEPPPVAEGTSPQEPDPDEPGMGLLEQLGYVDFGDRADPSEAGVRVHTEDAWPGVNLYLSLPDAAAHLMDMDGEVLHSWRDTTGTDTRWSRVELLPDGDVLCISPKENHLIRMRWDGRERWRIDLDAHHDLRWTPEGEILVLTRSLRQIPAVHPTRMTVDNEVTRLSADGEVLAVHSLYDILSTDPRIPIEAPAIIEAAPPEANVDPIHANTIELLTDERLAARDPIYATGNVLLTLRYTSAVAICDLEEERVLWWWGSDVLEGPHDASLLENGNLLLLDNGWEARGWSRVLEVDPLRREIVWEYRAPTPEDFFTAGRGTVQALPGGNVLVGNSNSGEAFEVTRAGELVWRFLNPSFDDGGGRAVLRIRRLPRERYEAVRERATSGAGQHVDR